MSDPFPPDWLPARLELTGDSEQDLALLHEIFVRDFVDRGVSFRGLNVGWARQTEPSTPYPSGFWHIVTRNDAKRGKRFFDPARAAKLPWCSALLVNSHEQGVTVWEHREGSGVVRTYVWLEAHDYVIVLQRRTLRGAPMMMLVTAYHVDGEGSRHSLRRKYERRLLGVNP